MYGAELGVLITLSIDHPSFSKEVVDAVVELEGGVIPGHVMWWGGVRPR